MVTPFDTEAIALCRHCRGRGYTLDETGKRITCNTCKGSGRVIRHSVGTLSVIPYKEDNIEQ